MEQKKVTYTGVDTEDVTEQLEQGNAKLAENGWRYAQFFRGPGDLCPGRAGRG